MSGTHNAYADFKHEHERFLVLEALVKTPGGSENDEIIQMNLVSLGFRISHQSVLRALGWLEEHKLVSLEKAACFTIATLRRDGADVYAGREPLPEGMRRSLAGNIGGL